MDLRLETRRSTPGAFEQYKQDMDELSLKRREVAKTTLETLLADVPSEARETLQPMAQQHERDVAAHQPREMGLFYRP